MVVLIHKLLRDLRLPLLVIMLLLGAFQYLWAKVVEQVSGKLLPELVILARQANTTPEEIEEFIFDGPGKFVKAMIGGDSVSMFKTTDMLTVGYVHAVMITILCIWAIGRASSAIVGEIDRGTMELLLAQPIARYKIVLAHLVVDLITIPFICLALWGGNWLGIYVAKPHEAAISNEPLPLKIKVLGIELALPTSKPLAPPPPPKPIDPMVFAPALVNVGALIFAMTGYTMWLSAAGRFRGRVLGLAVLLTLLQFLLNVIGQLWSVLEPFRKFTVFYYYQPQPLILKREWFVDLGKLPGLGFSLGSVHIIFVLVSVGLIGYAMALRTFTHRDLPAPL